MIKDTDFEIAKVGDKVWDFYFGWMYVLNNDIPNKEILVGNMKKLSDCDMENRYVYSYRGHPIKDSGDGLYLECNKRTLFWDEIKYDLPTKPFQYEFTVDEKDIHYNHAYSTFFISIKNPYDQSPYEWLLKRKIIVNRKRYFVYCIDGDLSLKFSFVQGNTLPTIPKGKIMPCMVKEINEKE